MAFYHMYGCSCPSGCCDCGTDYVYYNRWRNRFEVIQGRFQSRVPEHWEYLGELNGRYEAQVFED